MVDSVPMPSLRLVRFLCLTALVSLVTGKAAAQAGTDTNAVIRGIVYDSLITDAPLRGAEVWLEGTNRTVKADARGRFEFAGLRPGRYILTFFHPVLDSTGFSAAPVAMIVDAATPGFAVLTTPSPAAVHGALCPSDPAASVGAVLGLVREGVGGKPIGNIAVTAEWTAFTIAGGGNRWEARNTLARSDSSGRVVLCAVPTDVKVLIRGEAVGGTSGMVALDLAGRPFGRVDLHLLQRPATGTVMGVVRGRNGSLISGSSVLAVGTQSRVEADREGRFTFSDVSAGSRIFEARAIGYRPVQLQTTIPPGGTSRLEFIMGEQVQVLDPIVVAGSSYLATIGFDRRRKLSQGHYLDENDIERTGATRTEEIFRSVPGVLLRPVGMGYVVEFQRGQGQTTNPRLRNYCQPSYFIDGSYFPLPPNAAITLPMVPAEILAVELYSNTFSAPLQYQRRDSSCGVILIWTRRGQPKE
jgi:hypothetical protein